MFSNEHSHTAICDSANRASIYVSSSTPSSSGNSGAAVALLYMSAHQAFNTFAVFRAASVVPPTLGTESIPCAATDAFKLMGVFTLLSVILLTTT